jgi:hypothetical protein
MLLLILILLLLFGGGGYYAWRNQHRRNRPHYSGRPASDWTTIIFLLGLLTRTGSRYLDFRAIKSHIAIDHQGVKLTRWRWPKARVEKERQFVREDGSSRS